MRALDPEVANAVWKAVEGLLISHPSLVEALLCARSIPKWQTRVWKAVEGLLGFAKTFP